MNSNGKLLKGKSERLTKREKKIKKLLRKGKYNKEIINEIIKEARNPFYRIYKWIKYKIQDIFKK